MMNFSLPCPTPGHPRLLVFPNDWGRLRDQIKSDSPSARIFAALLKKAVQLLGTPPLERTMQGFRLLHVSRRALERISLLSMVAQLTGDHRYARRAINEMICVAGFSDWNPSHYLDTAEMSLAVAIGYDWLHDHLSDEEADRIATALRDKGIAPSLREPEQWFIRGNNNWNQVCHSGLSAAAIVLADREPELSLHILQRAVENLPASAGAYAPDGAYAEGPMYWNYGTLFHVVLAAALQQFLGSTCGVDTFPGFAESAEYVAQMTTPTGAFFPYADSRPTRHLLIPLFWFARQFRRPDWLNADLQDVDRYMTLYEAGDFDDSNYRLLALALLWRDPTLMPQSQKRPRLHWLGKGPMPVAAHRTAIGDPQALYAAIKGGSPSLNHAHMDAGTFFLQSDGVVWATDLGMQQYESLESIDVNVWDASDNGVRWSIFRLGPDGHNILRFNGAPQVLQGNAQFTKFQPEGPAPHSVLDLSPLYAGATSAVHRGLMFIENRAVLLQDEWTAAQESVEVSWQMLTTAGVKVLPDAIELDQSGKNMTLQILDSPQIKIEVVETTAIQKPFDAQNPGAKRISITLRTEAGQTGSLRILAVPGSAEKLSPPRSLPLSVWS